MQNKKLWEGGRATRGSGLSALRKASAGFAADRVTHFSGAVKEVHTEEEEEQENERRGRRTFENECRDERTDWSSFTDLVRVRTPAFLFLQRRNHLCSEL